MVQDVTVLVVAKLALPALEGGVEVVDDDAFAVLLPVLQEQDDRSRVVDDPRPELHVLDADPHAAACQVPGGGPLASQQVVPALSVHQGQKGVLGLAFRMLLTKKSKPGISLVQEQVSWSS